MHHSWYNFWDWIPPGWHHAEECWWWFWFWRRGEGGVKRKWWPAVWFPVLTNMRAFVVWCWKSAVPANYGWLCTTALFCLFSFFSVCLLTQEKCPTFCFSTSLIKIIHNLFSIRVVHIVGNTGSFTLDRDEIEYLTEHITSCNCCFRQYAKIRLWYLVEQAFPSHPRNKIYVHGERVGELVALWKYTL